LATCVLGTLLGKTCFLYGAHEEERLQGPPGKVLARRDGAICIGTVDGAVWISHLKAKAERRLDDESHKPLACYRAKELERMQVNFFGPDLAYHEARRRFVFKGNPPPQGSRAPLRTAVEAINKWLEAVG
jgi:Formyl transferase, C-terminal domain